MSGIRVDSGELSAAIMREMEAYAGIAVDTVKKITKDVSKDTAKNLKSNAPKRTGKYAASWKSKKEYETSVKAGYVVYSKEHYRLTHLLENGHAKRNGGRVAAKPHIASEEEKAIAEFIRRLREEL